MDCSTSGFPVSHHLPRFAQKSCPSSRGCHPTISPSVAPSSSCPQSFPASGSFSVKRPAVASFLSWSALSPPSDLSSNVTSSEGLSLCPPPHLNLWPWAMSPLEGAGLSNLGLTHSELSKQELNGSPSRHLLGLGGELIKCSSS